MLPRTCGRTRVALTLTGALAIFAGCSDDSPTDPEGALFVLDVSGEEFSALVTEESQIADLTARMNAGSPGVVSGVLARGDGGFNAPWGWHWEPETVEVADLAVELCDGRPSMVDEDLDYWIDTVGFFCPWGATVVRRDR